MARSDLLRKLLASYSRSDDEAFSAAALSIIDDERRKGHHLLADDLAHALTRDRRQAGLFSPTMQALPKTRDERALVSFTKSQHLMDDLVLPTATGLLLAEVIEENRNRSLLASHRLSPRQRLLFVGPPGTGKSAAAHAIAAELSLPVATVSLAALTSSLLGETARNIEAVIKFAETTPCVLLFDEFDVVATDRAAGSDHAELRRVVATVLQLIEGLSGESVVVATSNHAGQLDAAIWRRFEQVVQFEVLGATAAERLLHLRLRGVPHSLNVRRWAKEVADLPPAEIEALCLDAQRRWVLSGEDKVTTETMATAVRRWRERRREYDRPV